MPRSFDVACFEQDFRSSCVDCIHLLANKFNERPFYGVAIYIDAFEGDTGLYANTEEAFQQTLAKYRQEYPESYNHSDGVRDLKYSCGDWEYQSFGCPIELDRCFNAQMKPWRELGNRMLDEAHDFWMEGCRQREEIACRIAISPEMEEAIKRLSRTSDFLIAVCSHDEPSLAGVYRPMWFQDKGTLRGFEPMDFSSYR